MSDESLLTAVRAWRDEDPDADTRAELDGLLAAGDVALVELRDRFSGPLEFGTAGLRGEMGAGPSRMNEAVVLRATAGLAAYLVDSGHGGEPVIVGFDARHKSSSFAAAAASVLAGAGFRVLLCERPVPTPLVAFGVLHLGCCAGIQVTASHNPPRDNGYKVYLGDGAQIVPPADAEIAAHIAAVGPLTEIATGEARSGSVLSQLQEVYVERAVATALRVPVGARDVRVVYTPLHGVGRDVVLAAFERAGFPAPAVVAEQAEPDPDFPTVAFPNPEEPGALDLALALARAEDADVVLANDPDADRLAVAVPLPLSQDAGDGWRALTGDEIGVLLADWLLRQGEGPDRLVATSIVSSSQLGRLAEARGVHHAETLTGFKWIARAALSQPNLQFVYGYEEALGSCVGTLVRDKDGITAALAFAELVANERVRGRSVLDRLDDLARELGVHATRQRSIPGVGADVVDRLADSPPSTIAGRPVTAVEDLRRGDRLPPTDGVVLRADGARLIIRPSGTEPKLKCYAEAVVPVDPSTDLPTARAQATATVDTLLTEAATLVG